MKYFSKPHFSEGGISSWLRIFVFKLGRFWVFLWLLKQYQPIRTPRLDKISTLQVNADYQNDKDQALQGKKPNRKPNTTKTNNNTPQDRPKWCVNIVLFLFCQKEKRKSKPSVPKNSTQYLSKARTELVRPCFAEISLQKSVKDPHRAPGHGRQLMLAGIISSGSTACADEDIHTDDFASQRIKGALSVLQSRWLERRRRWPSYNRKAESSNSGKEEGREKKNKKGNPSIFQLIKIP